jgi:hypothetical protein
MTTIEKQLVDKLKDLIDYYRRFYTPLRASIANSYSPRKARSITNKLLKEISALESQIGEGEDTLRDKSKENDNPCDSCNASPFECKSCGDGKSSGYVFRDHRGHPLR